MIRFMTLCLFTLLTVPSALAQSIAVVDFMAAAQRTTEGTRANSKIEATFTSRQNELNALKEQLEKEALEIQNGSLIMSPERLAERQQAFGMKQAELQQRAMMAEQELAQLQMDLTTDIGEKMRGVAEALGKEKGFDLVIDRAVAAWVGPNVTDLTDTLVDRYNSTYK